ncbi:hypothetical protein DFJ77DRAFT_462685 [Powellomyces hirtus]|nr:hypothetical protein DFJ77DRAFT_462685 [Powellomyces hirtus]
MRTLSTQLQQSLALRTYPEASATKADPTRLDAHRQPHTQPFPISYTPSSMSSHLHHPQDTLSSYSGSYATSAETTYTGQPDPHQQQHSSRARRRSSAQSYSPSSAASRRPSRADMSDEDGDGAPSEKNSSLRRVAHSVVEKRRRERIRDKIEVLRSLVPTCNMQPNLHKLNVLEHTIDYIHFMRKVVHKMMIERDQALQQQQAAAPSPHHPPQLMTYQQQHQPRSVPQPHAPIPHNSHYMQFDIDFDSVQTLCPLPQPMDQHSMPRQRHDDTALPSMRMHSIPIHDTQPYGMQHHRPQHPMAFSAPSTWPTRSARRVSVETTSSATTAGSVPSNAAPSPMRVDNLLC